jgi:RNA polymerase sigma-70 factor (ECF subfamily)
VLDPDVVLRADTGAGLVGVSQVLRGSRAVAGQALAFQRFSGFARPALVNGAAGVVTALDGQPLAVMGFSIMRGRIVEIDILADPERLRRLDLTVLGD